MTPSRHWKMICLAGAVGLAATFAAAPAPAQEFYKGKTLKIMVSSSAGGGYDLYARFLGRHIERHIPGQPNILVQNVPGAGGMRLLNQAYNEERQDGTTVFTLHQNLPMYQRMGAQGVKYDARKLQGIGRLSAGNELLLASAASGIKSYKDLYDKELIVGSTGATSNSTVYPYLARNMLGLKFKVITGYKSSTEVKLAMERGELQGMGSLALGSMYVSAPEYLEGGAIVPLVQFGLAREKEWPDAPTVMEIAKSAEDKAALQVVVVGPEIGRSYWMGPEVPRDRVLTLRAAFDAMLEDGKFRAEFEQQKMLPRFATGAEMEEYIKQVFTAPQSSVDRLREAMSQGETGRCQDYSKSC